MPARLLTASHPTPLELLPSTVAGRACQPVRTVRLFTDFLDRHHADGLPVPEPLRRLNPPDPDRLALRRARRRGRRRDLAYVARGSLPSSVT
ncbi:hypothetical protein C6W96_01285 [Streptomyces sp. CS149]|nr:hypothetical protein C6W96_01285 [Streptomyces sp. CS149]